jgi:hypothetical protein
MIYNHNTYPELLNWSNNPLPDLIMVQDHLGGFSRDKKNTIFDVLNDIANRQNKTLIIYYHQILENTVKEQYHNLDIRFSAVQQDKSNLNRVSDYSNHPALNYKNFVCSFNGSAHVSRKLLVSIMNRFGYFDTKYCSKNFSYSTDILDGHVEDYVGDRTSFYRKFFISDNSEDFFQTIYSFGHARFDHRNNIRNLENKITQSFLHIVSETMATSYYPFVTEKFLYSILSRGLFLTYAQPGWHQHLENYYGFKKYTKLFDYRFDLIQNPVERVVELMTMISKFSMLTPHEWHDLYLIEQDTIEYNYDHYFSGRYLEHLKKHE